MNPYKESGVSGDNHVAVSWVSILKAGAVYFLALIVCTFLHAILSPQNGFFEPTVALQLANYLLLATPWIAGAIYLSLLTRRVWLLHGVIYSLLPGMLVLSGVTTNGKSNFENLITFATWQAASTTVTILTMAIVKLSQKQQS